jgi:hypothetical protein
MDIPSICIGDRRIPTGVFAFKGQGKRKTVHETDGVFGGLVIYPLFLALFLFLSYIGPGRECIPLLLDAVLEFC